MFCRAGSPESWTLEPQAVLWTANDASLSKNARTKENICVYPSLKSVALQ